MKEMKLFDLWHVLEKFEGKLRTESGETNLIEMYKLLNEINEFFEVKKVTVPQFVADFINYAKSVKGDPINAIWSMYDYEDQPIYSWVIEGNNSETLIQAMVNGYEVEHEKRYHIPLPNLVTSDGEQQFLTHKGSHFFASRKNPDLRQEWKEEDLQYVPEVWRKYAVEVAE